MDWVTSGSFDQSLLEEQINLYEGYKDLVGPKTYEYNMSLFNGVGDYVSSFSGSIDFNIENVGVMLDCADIIEDENQFVFNYVGNKNSNIKKDDKIVTLALYQDKLILEKDGVVESWGKIKSETDTQRKHINNSMKNGSTYAHGIDYKKLENLALCEGKGFFHDNKHIQIGYSCDVGSSKDRDGKNTDGIIVFLEQRLNYVSMHSHPVDIKTHPRNNKLF